MTKSLEMVIRATMVRTEEQLGLAKGFFSDLRSSNSDWEFIAKVGLFLEGYTTKILTDEFERPRMEDWLSRQTQHQRLKLARTLGIILDKHCSLFEKVSQIRNAYLHNLQNTGLTLADHFAADKKHSISIVNCFFESSLHYRSFEEKEKSAATKARETYHSLFLKNTRDEMINTLAFVTLQISGELEGKIAARRHSMMRKNQAERLLPPQKERLYIEETSEIIDFVRKAKKILKPLLTEYPKGLSDSTT
ncbi:hypothetical protein [Herbaspirillum seropedicae]|uniref:hypothetical protein n=1 Tax=Herbaspirillum seropedicae TaxID=964 RepID=UPI000847D5A0|nr:hypothetical protein [Herbaspirillum seropedicae]AON53806.1 hypothetical protein Hsc_1503 [Herbaspirillum seropedicae]